MYAHLFFIDSPIFNSEYVYFIKKNFDISEHRFIFAYNKSYSNVNNIKECICDPSILGVKGSLKYIMNTKYTQVFFHSMHYKAIYLVPRNYLKKINWCSWGHDVDNIPIHTTGVKQRIKSAIIKSKIEGLNSFIAGFKGDMIALSEIYKNINIKMINAIYPMGYDLSVFPASDQNIHFPIRIMIGHSAFQFLQHEKYLDLLAPYSDKICIYLVLNYGDEAYAERLKKTVKLRFKNYKIYDKFMDQKAYINLLNDIDFLVFDFKKQAAFGNILLGMYLKKQVYLAEDGVMYKTFSAEQLHFRTCQSLVEDIINPLNSYKQEELIINQKWAKQYLDLNQVIDQWNNVFKIVKEDI